MIERHRDDTCDPDYPDELPAPDLPECLPVSPPEVAALKRRAVEPAEIAHWIIERLRAAEHFDLVDHDELIELSAVPGIAPETVREVDAIVRAAVPIVAYGRRYA